jgi:hypothetical protein
VLPARITGIRTTMADTTGAEAMDMVGR